MKRQDFYNGKEDTKTYSAPSLYDISIRVHQILCLSPSDDDDDDPTDMEHEIVF